MAYEVMAYIVMACTVMACIVIFYIVMAYIVMAYIVMAYIVPAYTVVAYIVMAQCNYGLSTHGGRLPRVRGACAHGFPPSSCFGVVTKHRPSPYICVWP